jgi:hypothetical protein
MKTLLGPGEALTIEAWCHERGMNFPDKSVYEVRESVSPAELVGAQARDGEPRVSTVLHRLAGSDRSSSRCRNSGTRQATALSDRSRYRRFERT